MLIESSFILYYQVEVLSIDVIKTVFGEEAAKYVYGLTKNSNNTYLMLQPDHYEIWRKQGGTPGRAMITVSPLVEESETNG